MEKAARKREICSFLDAQRERLIEAGEHLLRIPELAYRETKTAAYVADFFRCLGLPVETELAITGVRAMVDSGRPGPHVTVMGELDALIVPNHPFADPETHAAHACGHHAGLTAMLGCAMALARPEIWKDLCGKVSFFAVPSEECQNQPYIASLIQKRQLSFFAGKAELIARGAFDDTDIALVSHAGNGNFTPSGFNGFVMKRLIFQGRSAHAGSYPHQGVNALSMLRSAMNLIDAQRDTFRDEDHVRIHGYIPDGGEAVNVVPDHAVYVLQVRASSPDSVEDASAKVDRCMKAVAIAFGGKVIVENIFAFMPLVPYAELDEIHERNVLEVSKQGDFTRGVFRASSTDMGDVSMIRPSLHPFFRGFTGSAHNDDFLVADPQAAYVDSGKMLALDVVDLLYGDGADGRRIAALPCRMTKEEYLETMKRYSSRMEF